jgi:hypothetical protein
MKLRVHEVNQAASGGSYVVIFEAEVQLQAETAVTAEVESVEPPNAEQELVEAARQAIIQGAQQVLSPLSRGAFIRVHRLVVHKTDFKPSRLVLYTAQELKRLVASVQ